VDADILLIDEVLSVGDLAFRNKCLQRLEALHSEGCSLLLVAHNLHLIRRVCDKVVVLEKGEVAFFGHSEEAIERYEALLRAVNIDYLSDYGGFNFVGAQLDLVQLSNGDGQPQTGFQSGGEVVLQFDLSVSQQLHQVTLNVVIENVEAIPVVWESLQLAALELGRHHFRLVWHALHLKAGRYSIRIGMAEGEFSMKAFRVPNTVQLHIQGDILKRGLYVPPADFTHCGKA
jgi:lipopolysaccharide transport system ATP-binding protein